MMSLWLPFLVLFLLQGHAPRITNAASLNSLSAGEADDLLYASVQLLETDDTVNLEKTRNERLPLSLPLQLNIEGTSHRLDLRKNPKTSPDDIEISYSDGSAEKKSTANLYDYHAYDDENNAASFTVEFITKKDVALTGFVEHGGYMYHVETANEDQIDDKTRTLLSKQNGRLHKLAKFSKSDFTKDSIKKVAALKSKKNSASQETQKAKKALPHVVTDFSVELLFLLDHSVYEHYLSVYSDVDTAKSRLRFFYSHLFSSLEFVYRNIKKDEKGYTVSLWLKKINVQMEPFLPSPSASAGMNDDQVITYNDIVERVKVWKEEEGYIWNTPDHVAYFTRYQIGTEDILGTAFLCGICSTYESMSANRDKGVHTWPVVAHELAHNLGAGHDGDYGQCDPDDNNIMTPYIGAMSSSDVLNAHMFSSCSLTDMRSCITGDEAWTPNLNEEGWSIYPRVCVTDPKCSHGESLAQYPGNVATAIEQCVLATNNPNSNPDNCANDNICLNLYCDDSDGACSRAFNAVDGTKCAPGKICLKGECLLLGSSIPSNCSNDPFDPVPEGCADHDDSGDERMYQCEETARNEPERFLTLADHYRLHCPATMHRYRLYEVGNSPCQNECGAGFQCADNQCLPQSDVCNGVYDCDSGEDEFNCPCVGFMCGSGKCIPDHWQCDDEIDCEDESDEELCHCEDEQFVCSSGECIEHGWKCDFYEDCMDGSDELNCEAEECPDDRFKCGNGQCLYIWWRCDGDPDCMGGEDEEACSEETDCGDSHLTCSSGRCIPEDWICDGDDDCGDSGDEENCADQECGYNTFECDNGNCINVNWLCDQDDDCGDQSDEQFCDDIVCPDGSFTCDNGYCITEAWLCDTDNDCGDNSDEANCTDSQVNNCGSYGFMCANDACASIFYICDGDDDCGDMSDEINCSNETQECLFGMVSCPDGMCIPDSWLCDSYDDCSDGDDERDCNRTSSTSGTPCSFSEFTCEDETCTLEIFVCDNSEDCADGSDERGCDDSPCGYWGFECGNGNCTSVHYQCDDDDDCGDGSDELDCTRYVACEGFQCNSGECLKDSDRCDSMNDCSDHSDEAGCPYAECDYGEDGHCDNGECIWEMFKCDGMEDCEDGSDELNCQQLKCPAITQSCDNGECVPLFHICDTVDDCGDGSDEEDCFTYNECFPWTMQCTNGFCIPKYKACDGLDDCGDNSDEENCPFCETGQYMCLNGQCIDEALKCNSKYDCEDRSDEEKCLFNCADDEFTCSSGECIPDYFSCDGMNSCYDFSDEIDCDCPDDTNTFICANGNCIQQHDTCNGMNDCLDWSDEEACTKVIHCGLENIWESTSLFHCSNNRCIAQTLQCNLIDDCGDGSDEVDCAVATYRYCAPGLYTCSNGNCVVRGWACDGENDCGDWSDELYCP